MAAKGMVYKWGRDSLGRNVRPLTGEEYIFIGTEMAKQALKWREWDTVSSLVRDDLARLIADWLGRQTMTNAYRIAHIAYEVDE